MYRLGHFVDGAWVEYSHPPVFERQSTNGNVTRLSIGVPAGDVDVLRGLMGCLDEPCYLLYVLVVPRGEGEAGRYQSNLVDRKQCDSFLIRYREFFRADGRSHLWVHSPSSKATLVWDRHNLIYAYGPVTCFEEELASLGFRPGTLKIPAPHEHCYRPECDADAAAILAQFDWRHSELQPGDDD